MQEQDAGAPVGGGAEQPLPDLAGKDKATMPDKVRFLTRLRNYLFAGIIVTAPIGLTIYLTLLVVHFVDDQVLPLIPPRYNPETYLPFSLPGVGLVVMLAFLIFVGFVAANFFGRIAIRTGERIVDRMPIVRSVYSALKQILETVLQQSSNAFRQVVLVEYPRRGIWAIAFLTSETEGEVQRRTDEQVVSVFLPTTPNPTSGFLLLVPKEDVIYLDMTVEEAAKMIISGGVVIPPDRSAPGYEAPEPVGNGRRRRAAE
jgi:uncharacterized membrane protein